MGSTGTSDPGKVPLYDRLLGLPWEEAQGLLAAAGQQYSVRETSPVSPHPSRAPVGEQWRVVQVRRCGGEWEVTLARAVRDATTDQADNKPASIV